VLKPSWNIPVADFLRQPARLDAATVGAIAAGSQVHTMSNISCHRTAVSVSTGHGREVAHRTIEASTRSAARAGAVEQGQPGERLCGETE
jgi:hypothetical protein